MNAIALQAPRLRIRGPALRRALIAGARRVIADRDVLNKINVFPVADGDTGSGKGLGRFASRRRCCS